MYLLPTHVGDRFQITPLQRSKGNFDHPIGIVINNAYNYLDSSNVSKKRKTHMRFPRYYYYGESIRSIDVQASELVPTQDPSYGRSNYRVIKRLNKRN